MRLSSLSFFVLFSFHAFAQKDNVLRNPTEIPVVYNGVTVPLSEYVEDPNAVNEITRDPS